ncbi:unnamed protein product [Lampetra planeri]
MAGATQPRVAAPGPRAPARSGIMVEGGVLSSNPASSGGSYGSCGTRIHVTSFSGPRVSRGARRTASGREAAAAAAAWERQRGCSVCPRDVVAAEERVEDAARDARRVIHGAAALTMPLIWPLNLTTKKGFGKIMNVTSSLALRDRTEAERGRVDATRGGDAASGSRAAAGGRGEGGERD